MGAKIGIRLSVMMFIQYFAWSAWFNTLGQALGEHGLGSFGGGAYGSAPLAAIIAPLFLGLIADRFFSSERVMGVLFLVGGAMLFLVPGLGHQAALAAQHGDKAAVAAAGSAMVWLFIGYMLCYMPTMALSNAVAFANIDDQNEFPKIRVWGTIGWIVSGLFIGIMGWSASFNMFWVGGAASVAMGIYSFTLPHTPPPARGKPVNLRTLLMVDALSMLARPPFLVFIVCSTLICVPLAYYYGVTSMYLGNTGFVAPAATMTLGQMSEIVFMLLIPFFFRRMGVKYMILMGMVAWVVRYALFAFGAPHQVLWMIYLGVAMHGLCYDFFFVTGFMYTDKIAAADIRGQAQSMLVFFTQGVGMYFGYWVAFARHSTTVTHYKALSDAIVATQPAQPLSFVDSLMHMFSTAPLKVSPQLLTDTMAQWKTFWLLPAAMAGVIAVLFFVLFWDKMSNYDRREVTPTDMARAIAAEEQP